MKKLITQSIGLTALVVIVFTAIKVSAGNPAVQNPGGFPGNNTPFPVNVGQSLPDGYQIKIDNGDGTGGGLAVREFIAWANASFSKEVGIQGILTGKPVSTASLNSNLLFGKPNYTFVDPSTGQTRTANNTVIVGTTGWTYTQNGGLYTPEEIAPVGKHQPLCANNDGQIIICLGVPPITPAPVTP